MAKIQMYFSHDSGARNDEKILRLRMVHGAEGYGVYFMVLEWMRESEDYSLTGSLDIVAFDLKCSVELLRSVMEDFGLFEKTDNGRYISTSFTKRMGKMESLSQKRREAVAKRKDRQTSKKQAKTLNISKDAENSTTELQKTELVAENKKENKNIKLNTSTEVEGGEEACATPPPSPSGKKNISELGKAAHKWLEDGHWRAGVCEAYGVPREVLEDVVRSFVCYGLVRGNADPNDWLKFFANCMRGKLGQKWIKEAVEKREKDKRGRRDSEKDGERTDFTNDHQDAFKETLASENSHSPRERQPEPSKKLCGEALRKKFDQRPGETLLDAMKRGWKKQDELEAAQCAAGEIPEIVAKFRKRMARIEQVGLKTAMAEDKAKTVEDKKRIAIEPEICK